MKKWDKWKKRILAFVVTGCMLLDSDMAVLAEETQKVVSNLYDEYQTEQLYKKQYEETVGQVQPEQSAENNDDLKKNLKDAEVLVESAFNEKEQVSLRLPEITKYTDEKEVELTGLYGEPVEVKEHEQVFQVDATHYVTLLTSEANTYESTSGEMRPVDLTLIPKDIEGKEEVKTPTEEEIRDPNLDLIYEPKDSSIDISFPANVTEERGIEITNKEHTLELFPQEGTYGNATIRDHALLYNNVQENIDVEAVFEKNSFEKIGQDPSCRIGCGHGGVSLCYHLFHCDWTGRRKKTGRIDRRTYGNGTYHGRAAGLLDGGYPSAADAGQGDRPYVRRRTEPFRDAENLGSA